MLSDANPMVVANALASLQEVQEVSGKVSESCTCEGEPGVSAKMIQLKSKVDSRAGEAACCNIV